MTRRAMTQTRTNLLILAVLLLLAQTGWGATYYMRVDGSAANVAAATGPASDASKCMNVAVHNAGTFSAGDTIYVDGTGGAYVTAIIPPSSGTGDAANQRITYQGANGAEIDGTGTGIAYLFNVSSKNWLTINDIESHHAEGGTGSCFCFQGTSTGIVTNRLNGHHASNQAFQHLNTVSVTHNSITGTDCTDDGFSMHGGTCVINGGTFTDNANGINIVSVDSQSVLTGSDITISGCSDVDAGIWLTSPTVGVTTATLTKVTCANCIVADSGCVLTLNRSLITGQGDHQVDTAVGASTITLNDCIFVSPTAAKFAVSVKSTATVAANNCVVWDSDNNGRGFFLDNNATCTVKNCILMGLEYGVFTVAGYSLTLSNNNFYSNTSDFAGAGYGPGNTNGIAADPLFVTPGTDFHLLSTSPCRDAGADLGDGTLYLDYDGKNQDKYGVDASGNPAWEIGAYAYRPKFIFAR